MYEWIQGENPAKRQWDQLLYAVVTILKNKIAIIDNAIYIKVFSHGKFSYLTFSIDSVINNTTNLT